MPYADDSQLLALYPEAANIDPALRTQWRSFAEGIVHESTFDGSGHDSKDVLAHAHAAMTMHLLSKHPSAQLDEAGTIQSVTIGPLNVSYAAPPVDEAGLKTSPYGGQYLLLRDARLTAFYGEDDD